MGVIPYEDATPSGSMSFPGIPQQTYGHGASQESIEKSKRGVRYFRLASYALETQVPVFALVSFA
jgi:hypothetical protein